MLGADSLVLALQRRLGEKDNVSVFILLELLLDVVRNQCICLRTESVYLNLSRRVVCILVRLMLWLMMLGLLMVVDRRCCRHGRPRLSGSWTHNVLLRKLMVLSLVLRRVLLVLRLMVLRTRMMCNGRRRSHKLRRYMLCLLWDW